MVVILTVVIVANVIRDERLKKKYIFGQFIFWNETTTYFEKSLRSILIFWDITHFETFFYFGPIAILLLVHCVWRQRKICNNKKVVVVIVKQKTCPVDQFHGQFSTCLFIRFCGLFLFVGRKTTKYSKTDFIHMYNCYIYMILCRVNGKCK